MRQWALDISKKDAYQFKLLSVPVPSPQESQVLVRLQWIGVCGTDVEFFRGQYDVCRLGALPLLGHEPSGIVEALGSNAPAHLLGARVTFRYHYGCFAEFVCADWRDLFALPDGLDPRDGTIVEVLPSVLSAVDRARIDSKTRVLVIGQGTSGLLMTAVLAQHMPRELIAADLMPERKEISTAFGATGFVVPLSPLATAGEISRMAGSFDVVFVACYSPQIVEEAVKLCNRNGRVMIYGGIGPARIDLYDAHRRRVDLMMTGMDDRLKEREFYREGVRLIQDGYINTAALHTHEFGFEDVPRAFELRATPRPDMIHALIRVSEEGAHDEG